MGQELPELDPAVVAGEILRKIQRDDPPVDLQDCLSLLGGVKIVQETLAGTGYLLELSEEDAEILVNRRAPSARQRFTVAHELGHLILQRITRRKAPHLKSHSSTETEIERWCEKFAVSLLMPDRWIRRWIPNIADVGNAKILFLGPQRFGVSKEAFYLRLNDIFGIIVVERVVRGSDIMLRLFPRKWEFPDSSEVAATVGKMRFGEHVWGSARGGISGGPFSTTIDRDRVSLVFVLRGRADSGSHVNAKLSRFGGSD